MRKTTTIILVIMTVLLMTACGHAHTWQDADCTVPKTCLECGETEGEPLGHEWREATCTKPETCSVCGETKGEALGHLVKEWSVAQEATCAAEGKETGICERCGSTAEKQIPKADHTPGEWVVTTNATIDTEGEKIQYCTVCGAELKTEKFNLSPEEIEAQYKAGCSSYDYDTIARDPDNYMFTYGKYTGEVIQVIENGDEVQMRVNITQERYGYTDTIYVVYTVQDGESRLLEDDIVTIYGMNMGTISYESVLGATITIPCVYAEYIDLN